MKRLVRSGKLWVGLAALSWGLGFSNCAWAGHGSHGSSGGSHGSSGGSSGGYHSRGSSGGSSGGYYSHGSSGGSSGGYHSHGSSGGSGGNQPAPAVDVPPSANASRRSSVLLTIFVPADAKLYIENQPTQLTGTRREFISPRLEAGKNYVYTLKAEVGKSGQTMSGTEELQVKAGDHKTVEFGPSALNPNILVAGRR